MNIYEIITAIIPPEMVEAMGECAYQRLLFCSGLFVALLPYILVVGFTAWVLFGLFRFGGGHKC